MKGRMEEGVEREKVGDGKERQGGREERGE